MSILSQQAKQVNIIARITLVGIDVRTYQIEVNGVKVAGPYFGEWAEVLHSHYADYVRAQASGDVWTCEDSAEEQTFVSGTRWDENAIPFDGTLPGYDDVPPVEEWDADEVPF